MCPGRLSTDAVKARIKPGCIVYVPFDFIRTSKTKIKYIVIAYVDFDKEESLVFIINSEIPLFIKHDAHLSDGQIPLRKTRYQFFTKDCSYMNCVDAHPVLDLDNMIDYLSENPDNIKGELLVEDIEKVVSFVKNAQTINRSDKKIITKSLLK